MRSPKVAPAAAAAVESRNKATRLTFPSMLPKQCGGSVVERDDGGTAPPPPIPHLNFTAPSVH